MGVTLLTTDLWTLRTRQSLGHPKPRRRAKGASFFLEGRMEQDLRTKDGLKERRTTATNDNNLGRLVGEFSMTTETSQSCRAPQAGVAQEKAETKQTQLLSTPSGKAIRNSYADESLSLSTKPKASAEMAVKVSRKLQTNRRLQTGSRNARRDE